VKQFYCRSIGLAERWRRATGPRLPRIRHNPRTARPAISEEYPIRFQFTPTALATGLEPDRPRWKRFAGDRRFVMPDVFQHDREGSSRIK